MTHLRNRLAALIFGGVLVQPAGTLACPSCFGQLSSGVFETYLLSTIALTLLPFAIIGAIAAVALHVKRQAERAGVSDAA